MDARAESVYDFMIGYQNQDASDSVPPTFDEIAIGLGLPGRGSVEIVIKRLVEEGRVVEHATRKARKYRAVDRIFYEPTGN